MELLSTARELSTIMKLMPRMMTVMETKRTRKMMRKMMRKMTSKRPTTLSNFLFNQSIVVQERSQIREQAGANRISSSTSGVTHSRTLDLNQVHLTSTTSRWEVACQGCPTWTPCFRTYLTWWETWETTCRTCIHRTSKWTSLATPSTQASSNSSSNKQTTRIASRSFPSKRSSTSSTHTRPSAMRNRKGPKRRTTVPSASMAWKLAKWSRHFNARISSTARASTHGWSKSWCALSVSSPWSDAVSIHT